MWACKFVAVEVLFPLVSCLKLFHFVCHLYYRCHFQNVSLLKYVDTVLNMQADFIKSVGPHTSNLIRECFFCASSLQGGRKRTTSPLTRCATTQLRSCTVWSWTITTTASAPWRRKREWARSSSSAPAPRTSATGRSYSTKVRNARLFVLFHPVRVDVGLSACGKTTLTSFSEIQTGFLRHPTNWVALI